MVLSRYMEFQGIASSLQMGLCSPQEILRTILKALSKAACLVRTYRKYWGRSPEEFLACSSSKAGEYSPEMAE